MKNDSCFCIVSCKIGVCNGQMPVLQLNSGLGGVIQKWQVAIGNIGKSFWKKQRMLLEDKMPFCSSSFWLCFAIKPSCPIREKVTRELPFHKMTAALRFESSLLGFTNTWIHKHCFYWLKLNKRRCRRVLVWTVELSISKKSNLKFYCCHSNNWIVYA